MADIIYSTGPDATKYSVNPTGNPKPIVQQTPAATQPPVAPAVQAQPQVQGQGQVQTPPATATGGGKATGNTIPDRGRGIGEVQGTGDGQAAGINATSPTVSIWRSQVRSGVGDAQDPGGVLRPLHGALGASVAGDDAIARTFGWTPNQSGGRSRQQALSDAGIAMRGQDAKDRAAFNQAAANTFGSSMEGGLADQRAQQFQKFTENPFLSVNPNTFGAKEWSWLGSDADAKNKNDFRAVKLSDQDRSARVNYLQKWMTDPYNVQRYGHLIRGMVETNGDKPMTDAQLRWSANFATRMDRQRKADTDLAQAQAAGFDKRAVGQYRDALRMGGVDTSAMSDSDVKDVHAMKEAQQAMVYFAALQKQRFGQELDDTDREILKRNAGNGLYGRAFGGDKDPGLVMSHYLRTMPLAERNAFTRANVAGKNRTPEQEKLVSAVQKRAAAAMLGQLRDLATNPRAGAFNKYMTLMGMYNIGHGGVDGRTNDGMTSSGQASVGKADAEAINRLLGYRAPATPAAPAAAAVSVPASEYSDYMSSTERRNEIADAMKNPGPVNERPPWEHETGVFHGPNEDAQAALHHNQYPRSRARQAPVDQSAPAETDSAAVAAQASGAEAMQNSGISQGASRPASLTDPVASGKSPAPATFGALLHPVRTAQEIAQQHRDEMFTVPNRLTMPPANGAPSLYAGRPIANRADQSTLSAPRSFRTPMLGKTIQSGSGMQRVVDEAYSPNLREFDNDLAVNAALAGAMSPGLIRGLTGIGLRPITAAARAMPGSGALAPEMFMKPVAPGRYAVLNEAANHMGGKGLQGTALLRRLEKAGMEGVNEMAIRSGGPVRATMAGSKAGIKRIAKEVAKEVGTEGDVARYGAIRARSAAEQAREAAARAAGTPEAAERGMLSARRQYARAATQQEAERQRELVNYRRYLTDRSQVGQHLSNHENLVNRALGWEDILRESAMPPRVPISGMTSEGVPFTPPEWGPAPGVSLSQMIFGF